MKPPRYTALPLNGGERVEGYIVELGKLSFSDPKRYGIIDKAISIHGSDTVFNFNIVEVDPATVEPVRMAVIIRTDEVFPDEEFCCPNCGVNFAYYNRVRRQNNKIIGATPFCGACGQALEWPEDKEG